MQRVFVAFGAKDGVVVTLPSSSTVASLMDRVHQKTGAKPARLFLRRDGVSFQLDAGDTVQVALQDGDVVHTAPLGGGAQGAQPAAKKVPAVVVPLPPKAAKPPADDDSDSDSDSDEPAQPPGGGAAVGKKGQPAKRMTKDAIAWLRAKFAANGNALAAPSKMQAESLATQCVVAFPTLKDVVTSQKVLDQAATFRKSINLTVAAPAAAPAAGAAKPKAAASKPGATSSDSDSDSDDDSSDSSSDETAGEPVAPKPGPKSPLATVPPAAAGALNAMDVEPRGGSQKSSQKRKSVSFREVESDSDDDDDDDDDARPQPKKTASRGGGGGGNGAALPYKPPAKLSK